MSTPTPPTQPTPEAPAPSPAPSTPSAPSNAMKGMALLVCLLSGAFAAVVAFVLVRHLGGEPLVAICSAGVTFLAVNGQVMKIAEKFGHL
ncbi:hypothetical protein ACFWB1_20445 [Streptomyces goshikiensis]|uniref:hypothetical protein n=1 Tax=Streptomyces goshikiensis TaxID=1942 RepID=UPI003689BCC9